MHYRGDVKIFKALADENRLAILDRLKQGETCVCVLLEELAISQSTLSHHMKILCDSGLVEYRKEGKSILYSLSVEGCRSIHRLLGHYTCSRCKDEEDQI